MAACIRDFTGIEAGLSATGDIFNAIAQRANTSVAELSKGLENYRAGQTGLLRMTWDNGDRTVLVNANLGGITLGWNLQSTAQDELFAAIEGTAFHTRIILDRMAEHQTSIERVINGGGIPQSNRRLNQVYANVLGKPVLVPSKSVTSLGSAIFAFMAAGAFNTIEEAQKQVCPEYIVYQPQPDAQNVYRPAVRVIPQDLLRFWPAQGHQFWQRPAVADRDRQETERLAVTRTRPRSVRARAARLVRRADRLDYLLDLTFI